MPEPNQPVFNSGGSARQAQFRRKLDRMANFSVRFRLVSWIPWMGFHRSDSKTFENAIHIAKIVLVLPAHGYEAEKSTLVVQWSCILPQKPLDTESPEKVHKNRDSGPFAAFLGRRL
jgi:hypothetical protein